MCGRLSNGIRMRGDNFHARAAQPISVWIKWNSNADYYDLRTQLGFGLDFRFNRTPDTLCAYVCIMH